MNCNQCGLNKDINEFYTKEKINKDGITYTYINPKCKQCVKDNINKWRKDNPERTKAQVKKYRQKESFHISCKNTQQRSKEKQKEWKNNNKEKLKQYYFKKQKQRQHKIHNISKDELNILYKYSNSCCMYCGMTEEQSLEIYHEKLHKDHAINDGTNGIENCVLACKGCNSWKHTRDWDEWYTPDKSIYNQERYGKINKWLTGGYKKRLYNRKKNNIEQKI